MYKIHGYRSPSKTIPEYNIWRSIKQRCKNKNHKSYKDYGARGIKICKRWDDSFLNFLIDMGLRPNENYSINRINNDGNYCKSNCEWALWGEQTSNKRNNIYVKYKGKELVLPEAARLAGIQYATAYRRIKRNSDWLTGKRL